MNKDYIDENIKVLTEIKKENNILKDIYKEVINCLNNGNKLIFIGNGGSAADATHIAAEFVGRFFYNRKSLAAISLTDNTATITAISNDYSYNEIFKKQLESLGNEGDILFGITTSCKSENVLNALDYAKSKNIKAVLVTGNSKRVDYDYIINIPSSTTSIVQNCYMVLFHMLCLEVDKYYYEHRN